MTTSSWLIADGRYEILEKLGDGGVGEVYKGFDRLLGINVAFKCLLSNVDQLSDQINQETIINEAKALAKLPSHSNVTSLINLGIFYREGNYGVKPELFLVFEYIPNGSLETYLRGNQGKTTELEIANRLQIAILVCNGLAHAHQHNIIHRDVKPKNILLGENNLVKITDFGMAKILDTPSKFTEKGGTKVYMAPEQFEGNALASEEIDIWQLGVTFYELFTGSLPYQPSEIPAKKEANELSTHNQAIPKEISDCILSMLSIEPSKRPKCKEVLNSLQKIFENLDPKSRELNNERVMKDDRFVNIRRSLKDKFKEGVETLVAASDGISILPKSGEKQIWYATVLIRPSQGYGKNRSLERYFSTIYFVEYEGTTIKAYSDWETTPDLAATRLDIDSCSSGLPVRWYEERIRLQEDENQRYLRISHHSNFVNFVALTNVKHARFDDPQPNIIKATYATDRPQEKWSRSVGWDLHTIGSDSRISMSQEIQTCIIVPIYNPFSKRRFGNSDDIIGVANFEWEEDFNVHRVEEVGTLLSSLIQEENCFAFSPFACEVLPNITPVL